MNLNFTQDPEWILMREKQWEIMKEEFSDDTRKTVKRAHDYFMTGILPSGFNLDARQILQLFPGHSIEALEFCIKSYIDKDKATIYTLYLFFYSSVDRIPWISTQEASELFVYVFGERYEKDRLFPFLLKGEAECKPIPLTPTHLFSMFTNTYFWLDEPDNKPPLACLQLDYIFSALPFVDKMLFDFEAQESMMVIIPGFDAAKPIQGRLRKVLAACVRPPAELIEGPFGTIWRNFFEEARERIDNLDSYPGELEKIWSAVKAGKIS